MKSTLLITVVLVCILHKAYADAAIVGSDTIVASEFLSCTNDGAFSGIRFETYKYPEDKNPNFSNLLLDIQPPGIIPEEPHRYTWEISNDEKKAILAGEKVVIRMLSDHTMHPRSTFYTGAALVVFNSGKNGETLIAARGAVFNTNCVGNK